MTSIRTLAAVLGLLSFCACAAAQGVTESDGTVNFTFAGFVTRVPVSPAVGGASGNVGPDLVCFTPAGAAGSAVGQERFGPSRDPGDLRTALFDNVYGKPAAGLIDLLAKVQNASSRGAKLQELFGLPQLSSPATAPIYLYRFNNAQLQQLRMGQEVSDPPPFFTSPGVAQKCYTKAQLDNAIAEGTRVVGELIRALQAPN